jgi:DMSO/TMAO reductase YedYZ molybdopterin-dependent catalytic subunit
MRRGVPLAPSEIELALAARAGLTRRGFLLAATATMGAIGAGAYAWNRYTQLLDSTGGGSAGLLQGEPLALTSSGQLLDTDFPDPCAGGIFLGYVPFRSQEEDSFRTPLYTNSGGGHGARLCIDLASLFTPEGRLTPADKFFIRTEYPDLLRPPADWKIKIHGLVKKPQQLPLKSLERYCEPKGPVLLECSGNGNVLKFGLLSVAEWAGIPIERVIKIAEPTDKAKAVLIQGFDDDTNLPDHGPPYKEHSWPTCSWIFPIEQLVQFGAFLATRMNGQPLPKDHGAPVRLVIPGWYGCSEVKWVNEIKFVDDHAKATWQMVEFSDRTNQDTSRGPQPGFFKHPFGPALAKDYKAATIDQTALPVRVEQWKLGGKIVYRIVGITWGGPVRSEKMKIRFRLGMGPNAPASKWAPLEFCKAATSNSQYGIWVHTFTPPKKGRYYIQVRMEDPKINHARRLQRGDYDRGVFIPEV